MEERVLLQALLLSMLAGSLLLVFFNPALSAFFLAVFLAASVFTARRLKGRERFAGFFLIAFVSVLCLVLIFFTVLAGLATLFYLPIALLALLAFFLVFKTLFWPKEIEATVLAYSRGWAVVRIKKSFLHELREGAYAVESRPVRVGETVFVKARRGFFGTRLERVK